MQPRNQPLRIQSTDIYTPQRRAPVGAPIPTRNEQSIDATRRKIKCHTYCDAEPASLSHPPKRLKQQCISSIRPPVWQESGAPASWLGSEGVAAAPSLTGGCLCF